MGKDKNIPKKRRRELPPISDEFFNGFNNIRKQYNVTWGEVFERLYNYQDWVEHLFMLPLKASELDKINAITVTYLLPTWLNHIYQNFIKDNINVHGLGELINTKQKTSAVVIANGPSLHNDNNLEVLHDSTFYRKKKGVIISTAHTLKDCINVGIVPDYITLIDADEIEADFIDIDDEYMKNISCISTPSIHPKALKRWKGKKYFYRGTIPHRTIPNVQSVLTDLFPFFTEFEGGNNCGTVSWAVAKYIGCNPIALLGLDFAYKSDTPVTETQYYRAFRKSYKSDDEMFKNAYRLHTHSFFGTNCYTDDMFDEFRKLTVFMIKKAKKIDGVKTINCSPGIIDDPEIENQWFKDWLKKWE